MMVRRVNNWPTWNWANPFEELERMKMRMDWLSEGLTKNLWREYTAGVFPLINVTEDGDGYYVRAELPGIKAEDLDISVSGDSLSISGERTLPAEDERAKYHRREREAGKFSRVFTLPSQVDADKVEARCMNGILTVTLPKTEAAKPKQISVKTS